MGNSISRVPKMNVQSLNLPFKPVMSAVKFSGNADKVHFSGSKLLTDQMIRFDAPVTPETASMLSQALLQLGEMKKEIGGSVKMLISNSPGGSVYHGYHVIDTMANLEAPVDTIIMGGQTASMGALIFVSGSKGRRFMSQNASLLIHRPSASGIGGTQMEISDTAREIERMRKRIDHIISARSGVPVNEIKEMTDKNTIIYPLKALKLGFTDWVLVGAGDKALNRKSVEHLSEQEIDERDTAGDYDDLKTFTFDPMLSNMAKLGRDMSGGGMGQLLGLPVGGGGKKDDTKRAASSRFMDLIPLPTPIKDAPDASTGQEKPPGFDIYPYPRAFSVYA